MLCYVGVYFIMLYWITLFSHFDTSAHIIIFFLFYFILTALTIYMETLLEAIICNPHHRDFHHFLI